MIAALIRACVANRALVLLLAAGLVGAGIWSARTIAVDAIPDLSDVQVIIRTEYPGQSPQVVEDQVTYPLTTAMLGVPGARDVRGYSMVGSSFVYVLFEDGTDLYWARSRVLERLSTVTGRLPQGVAPELGPDATGVGWIYEYVLETGPYSPDHPDGLWRDPSANAWYADPAEAPAGVDLVHQRIFPGPEIRWVDPESLTSYPAPDLAPVAVRDRLERRASGPEFDRDPITGTPLVDPELDLSDLRSIQDWYLRFELTTADGVSEVATVGGMERQYQVVVDPLRLRALGIPLKRVREAVARSNQDVGGRLIERAETEYLVTGRGYLGHGAAGENHREAVLADLRRIALGSGPDGAPVSLSDVAEVQVGPQIRRGIAEWNGRGETVGGIVVMRSGENARDTIHAVRSRLTELESSLPPGVAVRTAYDRSDLIDRAVETLTKTLFEEIAVVSIVVLLFLLHVRSALVAVVVLPTGVLGSLVLMHLTGINANIMSLGGIALAIGVMVDSSIIMVENAHKHLERERERRAAGEEARPRAEVVAVAAAEVGPSLFFALLIITLSFLPVFVLTGQSGRLFTPLAFTKTFAMAVAALLSITLVPVLMVLFIRGRLRDEATNPLSRVLRAAYEPVFALALRGRYVVAAVAVVVVLWIGGGGVASLLGHKVVWPYSSLGSEFMPPLEEGDFLYMPNTDPGISITKARELLQQTDKLIAAFPEVTSVMGKIGRADTATDPAPLTMIETTIVLERDKTRWRQVREPWLWGLFHTTRPITLEELTDGYRLPGGAWVPGVNEVLRFPGLTGALTRGAMPIRTRIDMLATGIRTPVGIKVMGPDLAELSRLTGEIQDVLQADPRIADATRSVAADRTVGGSYLDLEIDRDAIARHGLDLLDVQQTIMTALGGATLTVTLEGRERYPVNVRYPRDLRETPEDLTGVLVATPGGAQVPLGQLATIVELSGPPMIKSENARPSSWLYVTPEGSDVGGYVDRARVVVADAVTLPAGYSLVWSGQFQYMAEAKQRLMVALPLTALAIVMLLYLATRAWSQVGIVLFMVPFSLLGAIGLVAILGYNMSTAVAVGMIALAGLDAETGLVMLHYLRDSTDRFRAEGRLRDRAGLIAAIEDGAVQRIRPKTMTVCTTFVGLLPLMFADGAGADTMRRLAAPMIGGLFTSFIGELVVYPVLWYLIHRRKLDESKPDASPTT